MTGREGQFPCIIELNVGGTCFTTRLSTLTKDKDSMLAAMFSGRHRVEQDSQGRYFIDRDGKLFRYILNYLRHDKLPPPDMAVDVLEEAEYYQLTELRDWCKAQDSVISKEIVELAEREENQTGSQILSYEVLKNLAKLSIVGRRSSLFQNGVDGFLVGTSGVLFVSRTFQVGFESAVVTAEADYFNTRPFKKSTDFFFVGPKPHHECSIHVSQDPSASTVTLAIYSDDVINPVVYAQRAAKRFNQVDHCVQLELEDVAQYYSSGCQPGDVALRSICSWCKKQTFFFLFKFLIHPVYPLMTTYEFQNFDWEKFG